MWPDWALQSSISAVCDCININVKGKSGSYTPGGVSEQNISLSELLGSYIEEYVSYSNVQTQSAYNCTQLQ